MSELDPRQEEIEAIDRIACSADGRLLHRYLRRVLEAVIDIQSDSALNSHNGRRSLARDLMRLMAKGIDEHGSSSSSDAPILTRAGGAVAVARRARRDPSSFPRVDSYGPGRNPDGSDAA